jgi:hypothetical protein
MAGLDSTARNSSPQIDVEQIVREARAIEREVLASLLHIWLKVPDCQTLSEALLERR